MKLNRFQCPTCGHEWYESGAYGTCDACQTFFYLSQARPKPPPQGRVTVCGLPDPSVQFPWYPT